MEKLISMTDFVLSLERDSHYYESQIDFYDGEAHDKFKMIRYAKFLKQPLTLGMFVPCDENGSVLPFPKSCNKPCSPSDWSENGKCSECRKEVGLYEKAKEKVLFKDCEVKEIKSDKNYFVVYHKSQQIWISWTDRIIEDIILNRTYLNALELTESALKAIGINQ